MPRALITGGTGFVGQWLVRALLQRGYAVTASGPEAAPQATVLEDDEWRAAEWRSADVRDPGAVGELLDTAAPDVIFHLAGIAYVPAAQDAPLAAYDVNGLGIARLLHVLQPRRAAGTLDPVVVVVGSGEQYGHHADATPLREECEQRPLTVYAASKAVQEIVALQAFRATGARVVATRSFNHSGPGQARHFLLPALVRRALDLRRAGGGALSLGNTTPVRDYLHVADVAEAYCRLAEAGRAGEAYNVSSGSGTSVADLARAVLQRVGLSAEISTDPSLVRAVDIPVLVGAADKLRRDTGWVPRHSLDTVIDDLIRSLSDTHASSH